jgi:hypothetical protein
MYEITNLLLKELERQVREVIGDGGVSDVAVGSAANVLHADDAL